MCSLLVLLLAEHELHFPTVEELPFVLSYPKWSLNTPLVLYYISLLIVAAFTYVLKCFKQANLLTSSLGIANSSQ